MVGHDARTHQLDAIAVRMSSLPARRDGRQAATTPASAASTTTTASEPIGSGERPEPLLGGERPQQTPAEERAEADAAQRAEDRHDHRLPAHRRANLAAGLSDRSQQTRVPGCARGSTGSACWRCPSGRSRRRAPASRTRRTASGRSPNPMLSMYSDRVCASGAEFRSVTAVTAARPSASETPSARSTRTTMSPACSACGAQSVGVMIMSPTFIVRRIDRADGEFAGRRRRRSRRRRCCPS